MSTRSQFVRKSAPSTTGPLLRKACLYRQRHQLSYTSYVLNWDIIITPEEEAEQYGGIDEGTPTMGFSWLLPLVQKYLLFIVKSFLWELTFDFFH
jgi:hypothetical protein